MPRASVTQKVVGVRHDGSVICKQPITRGRCDKLVANTFGQVHCPNGHNIDISDVLIEALNRPDAGGNIVMQFSLQGYDIRPFIRRLASAEFLGASRGQWQHNFLINRLDVFNAVLVHADLFEPECARVLREYWERKLPEFWPDIASYLALLKSTSKTSYIRFREQALLAFNRWSMHDPLRYLSWSELSLDAIAHGAVGSPNMAILYKHNIDESVRLLMGGERYPAPAPVFFTGHLKTDQFWFSVSPDPYRSYPDFNRISMWLNPMKSTGRVVCVQISIDTQDTEVHRNFNRKVRLLSEIEAEPQYRSPVGKRKQYKIDHGDKVEILLPEGKTADFTDPTFHLDTVRDFVSALYLRMEDLIAA
jgi:hypothetical protein